MSGDKSHWDAVFAQKEEVNLTWYQQDAEPSLSLIKEFSPSINAPIIDVGAGASRLVDFLIDNGFSDLTLLDISKTALDATSHRLGPKAANITKIISDITQWKPAQKWQLWHDRAVFHFLTTEPAQEAYITALKASTGPGAILIMGTFALDGPKKCSGLPVQRYSPQTLDSRLGEAFTLIRGVEHTHITPAENEQKFSFSLFKRT